jgi:ethanolamine transporter EutH
VFAGIMLLSPRVAHAYLDPGTGSFILQMLVGALLGGVVAIGVFRRRVIDFLKRIFGGGKQRDDKPEGK